MSDLTPERQIGPQDRFMANERANDPNIGFQQSDIRQSNKVSPAVLDDAFIDEAIIRFARGRAIQLVRYIEAETIHRIAGKTNAQLEYDMDTLRIELRLARNSDRASQDRVAELQQRVTELSAGEVERLRHENLTLRTKLANVRLALGPTP